MVRKKCKKLMNDQNFEEGNFMDFFGVLTMLGGLALFLYGMETMGNGLEKLSGGRLERILEKLTSNPIKAVLLGAGVTAVIQSSSATTVMVVGFVNSGIMKLTQAVGIIMGANIGTTATSWLLSLTGIESGNFFVRLLKPTSFSPALALIGVCLIMFSKKEKKKDAGTIMIGFAILMTGMETMSGAVKPLANVPDRDPDHVLKSGPWNDRRSCPHCDHPELFRIGRNSSGVMCNGSSQLRHGSSDHHGTEYRNMCDCNAFRYRRLQKCETCSACSPVL